MIAANDTDMAFMLQMEPDQLRRLIAHASGLLSYHQAESAPETLRRIAIALEEIGQTGRAAR